MLVWRELKKTGHKTILLLFDRSSCGRSNNQQSTKRNVDDAVDDGGGDEDNDGAGAVFPGCLNSDLRSDSMNRRDKSKR